MTTRAPSTQVDAEELTTTRSERALAVVLAVFLLIGTIWFYEEVADWVAPQSYGDAWHERSDSEEWVIGLLRLGFIAGWACGSLVVLQQVRRAKPRFLPLAIAGVLTGAVMAVVFAFDYIGDYLEPLDLGPLVLSVIGVVATIIAFVVLQRWLTSRIPGRRVRKGECPFCGYPLRGGGSHCEGCGRETIASCATCGDDRRVGSQHCVACGAA